MMKKNRRLKVSFAGVLLTVSLLTTACATSSTGDVVKVVDRPDTQSANVNYVSYRAPLQPHGAGW